MATGDVLLTIDRIDLSFGGLKVLNQISLQVGRHEIVSVIGPNGAGKTSVLNCVTGFYRPQRGSIRFDGHEMAGWRPDRIARLGIARVFQRVELFSGLSALENIMAGRHMHMKTDPLAGMLYFGRARNEEIRHRRVVEEIIDFLEIQHIRKKVVGTLPFGLRKRVELGRALALEPKLLLLDEPMSGMNAEEREDMARFVLDIYEERRIPIVLIEHDMEVVMDISDRVIVLDFGLKIAEGAPAEVKANPAVIKAYLGEV